MPRITRISLHFAVVESFNLVNNKLCMIQWHVQTELKFQQDSTYTICIGVCLYVQTNLAWMSWILYTKHVKVLWTCLWVTFTQPWKRKASILTAFYNQLHSSKVSAASTNFLFSHCNLIMDIVLMLLFYEFITSDKFFKYIQVIPNIACLYICSWCKEQFCI